jgi:hypothetical protein
MNYQTIFTGTRASSYQQAMATFPMARESEFRNLFNNFPLTTNETVLDVPSGGGYLGYFYPTNSIKSLEFTGGFNPDIDTVDIDSEWNIGCHDRAVCLAATHHIEDFRTFISNLVQCVYPSGIIHIADG